MVVKNNKNCSQRKYNQSCFKNLILGYILQVLLSKEWLKNFIVSKNIVCIQKELKNILSYKRTRKHITHVTPPIVFFIKIY